MKRIFKNRNIVKVINILRKKKRLINIFYIFYNSENRFIKRIKNRLISISIINFNLWKISFLSKNQVKSEFLDYIIDCIDKPEVILDLGSYNALQSIEFCTLYPKAKIFAFECNPSAIKLCKENILNLKNIEIIPKAVFNENKLIKFYHVERQKGVSSIYKVSSEYSSIGKFIQEEIEVEATRIDTWAKETKIDKIDLCWSDLQGAEYEALEGMGELIYTIQALYLEVEEQKLYNGQKLFDDVVKFLDSKGFTMIRYQPSKPGWWGNAIFLNNKLLHKK